MRAAAKWMAAAGLMLAGCTMSSEKFVSRVEQAHGVEEYQQRQDVSGMTNVTFGQNTMIEGVMVFSTPVNRTWIGMDDGSAIGFDGEEAWVSPASKQLPAARFHALTWPYFIAIASKLRDRGAHVESVGKMYFREGEKLPAARMTFDPGTGDSPDDWYIIYMDDDGRIAGLAYIVTYGKSPDDDDPEPHAAVYEAYQQVNGALLPRRIVFYNWRPEVGMYGEPIGRFEFREAEFVDAADGMFAKPDDARVDHPPGS